MITFQEHTETGYAMRTWDNARLSDLTIAFAIDFTTPGEILTRKAAYGKCEQISILDLLKDDNIPAYYIIEKYHVPHIKHLNIAGAGIYNLKKVLNQEVVDQLIFHFIKNLHVNMDGFSIRSGGQSGVDEAALKAGDKLGLETTCLAPKHWMFRGINGKDICNQSLFLKRFGAQYDITDIL